MMFKSKTRPIVIPQNEHGRLAGTLAASWGNADFERPAFDFPTFVRGVTLHDWHYGHLDNAPIGETAEAAWLEIVRRGIEHQFEDPVTDIVAKVHIKRLLAGRDSPAMEKLAGRVEARISERLPQTGHSRGAFEWADRITAFCDQVAFDFSFEQPMTGALSVYAKADDHTGTALNFEIRSDGEIWVNPWPFSTDQVQGMILGYRLAGYPADPVPEIVPFRIER